MNLNKILIKTGMACISVVAGLKLTDLVEKGIQHIFHKPMV